MAQDFNPADNLSDEDRAKGGKRSHSGGRRSKSSKTSGAAGRTEAAKRGGENSTDNQYTS